VGTGGPQVLTTDVRDAHASLTGSTVNYGKLATHGGARQARGCQAMAAPRRCPNSYRWL